MSVLDNIPGAQKPDYQFLSGDLSFIEEMDQEKQPMNIDERPSFGDELPTAGDEPQDMPDGEPDPLNASAAETAIFVTDIIDTGAAYGLAFISKGDAEQYMATPDQKSRIQKIIRVYCDRLGGRMPLWLQLLIILLIVYGAKVPGAIEERKINILEEKVAEQERRLKAYEAEKKADELRNELESRKREEKKEV